MPPVSDPNVARLDRQDVNTRFLANVRDLSGRADANKMLRMIRSQMTISMVHQHSALRQAKRLLNMARATEAEVCAELERRAL